VLAHVPPPGYPANALVASDGTIYTGTFKSFSASSDNGPSKVFAFAPDGRLLHTFTVTGQTPGVPHGVQVAASDRAGMLYLLDQDPARVVRLDPRTGAQTTWATFKSLPACPGGTPGGCSAGSGGNPPEPDFAAWGPDGSLYVTDYMQALIWRVPPRGGAASVWLTDPRFNGVIVGPAGIQLLGDTHTLMLSTGGGGTNPSTGKLYTIPIGADGKPGSLRQIWESAPLEAPDGFAVARSGNIYVALVGPAANAVVELSPQGHEIARVPANVAANDAMQVPFDAPGSVTFDGDNVIVANQSAIQNDTAHMALLEIAVGEPGLPMSLPPASAPTTLYRLTVSPAHPIAGRRTKLRFRATLTRAGRSRPVRGALVRFAGYVAHTGGDGRATITAVLHRHIRPYRAALLVGGTRVASATLTTTT
jgi:sugar lactone lactonase YvrE